MSVWKKASKSHQKTHRERHQPEERKYLGLLEKKKDYVQRARDYNEKKTALQVLRRKALNKNPDEFYHHMIRSKIDDGIHREKEIAEEDSPDQIKLMCSQDLTYVTAKRTQEMKKIQRMQAQMHMIDVEKKVRNKHIRFEKCSEVEKKKDVGIDLENVDLEQLAKGVKKKVKAYEELAKRINRERELAVVQRKLEIKRLVECKTSVLPPKKVKKGTKDRAPVYKWKYERKK